MEPTLCEIYWPNAFSPNQDGVNEIFKPEFSQSCEPANYRLTIYNRWGGQIFESENPNQGWNGESRGRLLNSGVYVYLAEYRLPDGSAEQKDGTVLLVR